MKILQVGCSGTYNYGDEMSHRSVRNELREIFPNATIIQLGVKQMMLEREHSDADDIVSFSKTDRIAHLAKEAAFWVYGPGTIMTPGPSILTARDIFNINKNVVIWGVGASSFVGSENSLGAEMIRKAALVTARDKQSADFMKLIRKDVHVVPDPMLSHIVTMKPKYTPEKRNGVTISSRILGRGGWLTEELQNSVIEQISAAMNEIGGDWYALPASWLGGEYDSDVICHRLLRERFSDLRMLEPKSFDDVTKMISKFDTYITSRLHTGVPAAGLGVKTILFGDDKTRYMAENWGKSGIFAGHYTDISKKGLIDAYDLAVNIFSNGKHDDIADDFQNRNIVFSSLRDIFRGD